MARDCVALMTAAARALTFLLHVGMSACMDPRANMCYSDRNLAPYLAAGDRRFQETSACPGHCAQRGRI